MKIIEKIIEIWYKIFINIEIVDDTMERQLDINKLFNVNDFNNWFNSEHNKSYAHSGIFLRLDKLCDGIIYDYFKYHYITDVENKMEGSYKKYFDLFRENIRRDWINKLNNK